MAFKGMNVNLQFTADTSKAKQQIQELQNTLNNLASNSLGSFNITKDLDSSISAAQKLSAVLQQATNVNTGKLDLSKLNASLKSSKMSLQQYADQLNSLGPAGQAAFAQVAKAISQAQAPTLQLGNLLTQLTTSLANVAKYQLSTSILTGFTSSIQSAFSYAQELNSSLNNIQIVTGQSADQMAAFAQKANEAAKKLSTTTTAYTDAALIFYQQGLDSKAVEERMNTVVKMMHATGDAASDVSSYMTAIWNNFDNGSQSLEHYADVIAALGASTASSSSEIAEGLSKFASIANTVGLSYDYATSALATLVANTRQSADTIGNSLKTIFSRLQGLSLGETLDDGTTLNKYSTALQKVGVSILDASGGLKDLDTILDSLASKWQTLSSAQQTALAQTVAGTRQYSQLISLMENWDDMQTNLKTASGSEGTLTKQQEIYAQSWKAARDEVQAAAESIYSSLIDDKFFTSLTKGFAEFLTEVNKGIENIGGLKGVLTSIAAIIGTTFSGKIANGVTSFFSNIMVGTKVAQKQFEKLRASSLQLLSSQTSDSGNPDTTSLTKLYTAQATAQQTLTAKMEAFKQLKTEINDLDQIQINNAQKIIDRYTQQAEQLILQNENIQNIKTASQQSAINSLTSINNRISSSSGGVGAAIPKDALTNALDANAMAGVISSISSELKTLPNNIPVDEIKAKMSALQEGISQAGIGNVSVKVKEAMEEVSNAIESKSGNVVEKWNNLISELQEASQKSNFAEKIKERFVNSGISVEEAERLVAPIKDALEKSFNTGAHGGSIASYMIKSGNAVKNFEEIVAKALPKTASYFQMVVSSASALSSATMAIRNLNSAIKTFSDKDATTMEKVTSAVTFLTTTMFALNSIKTVMMQIATRQVVASAQSATALGTEAAAAEAAAAAQGHLAKKTIEANIASKANVYLLIAGTILGVIAFISSLITAQEEAIKKQKELAKEVEDTRLSKSEKNVSDKKSELEENNKLLSNYNSLFQTYQKTKTGQDELRESAYALADAYGAVGATIYAASGNFDEFNTAIKTAITSNARIASNLYRAQAASERKKIDDANSYNVDVSDPKYKISNKNFTPYIDDERKYLQDGYKTEVYVNDIIEEPKSVSAPGEYSPFGDYSDFNGPYISNLLAKSKNVIYFSIGGDEGNEDSVYYQYVPKDGEEQFQQNPQTWNDIFTGEILSTFGPSYKGYTRAQMLKEAERFEEEGKDIVYPALVYLGLAQIDNLYAEQIAEVQAEAEKEYLKSEDFTLDLICGKNVVEQKKLLVAKKAKQKWIDQFWENIGGYYEPIQSPTNNYKLSEEFFQQLLTDFTYDKKTNVPTYATPEVQKDIAKYLIKTFQLSGNLSYEDAIKVLNNTHQFDTESDFQSAVLGIVQKYADATKTAMSSQTDRFLAEEILPVGSQGERAQTFEMVDSKLNELLDFYFNDNGFIWNSWGAEDRNNNYAKLQSDYEYALSVLPGLEEAFENKTGHTALELSNIKSDIDSYTTLSAVLATVVGDDSPIKKLMDNIADYEALEEAMTLMADSINLFVGADTEHMDLSTFASSYKNYVLAFRKNLSAYKDSFGEYSKYINEKGEIDTKTIEKENDYNTAMQIESYMNNISDSLAAQYLSGITELDDYIRTYQIIDKKFNSKDKTEAAFEIIQAAGLTSSQITSDILSLMSDEITENIENVTDWKRWLDGVGQKTLLNKYIQSAIASSKIEDATSILTKVNTAKSSYKKDMTYDEASNFYTSLWGNKEKINESLKDSSGNFIQLTGFEDFFNSGLVDLEVFSSWDETKQSNYLTALSETINTNLETIATAAQEAALNVVTATYEGARGLFDQINDGTGQYGNGLYNLSDSGKDAIKFWNQLTSFASEGENGRWINKKDSSITYDNYEQAYQAYSSQFSPETKESNELFSENEINNLYENALLVNAFLSANTQYTNATTDLNILKLLGSSSASKNLSTLQSSIDSLPTSTEGLNLLLEYAQKSDSTLTAQGLIDLYTNDKSAYRTAAKNAYSNYIAANTYTDSELNAWKADSGNIGKQESEFTNGKEHISETARLLMNYVLQQENEEDATSEADKKIARYQESLKKYTDMSSQLNNIDITKLPKEGTLAYKALSEALSSCQIQMTNFQSMDSVKQTEALYKAKQKVLDNEKKYYQLILEEKKSKILIDDVNGEKRAMTLEEAQTAGKTSEYNDYISAQADYDNASSASIENTVKQAEIVIQAKAKLLESTITTLENADKKTEEKIEKLKTASENFSSAIQTGELSQSQRDQILQTTNGKEYLSEWTNATTVAKRAEIANKATADYYAEQLFQNNNEQIAITDAYKYLSKRSNYDTDMSDGSAYDSFNVIENYSSKENFEALLQPLTGLTNKAKAQMIKAYEQVVNTYDESTRKKWTAGNWREAIETELSSMGTTAAQAGATTGAAFKDAVIANMKGLSDAIKAEAQAAVDAWLAAFQAISSAKQDISSGQTIAEVVAGNSVSENLVLLRSLKALGYTQEEAISLLKGETLTTAPEDKSGDLLPTTFSSDLLSNPSWGNTETTNAVAAAKLTPFYNFKDYQEYLTSELIKKHATNAELLAAGAQRNSEEAKRIYAVRKTFLDNFIEDATEAIEASGITNFGDFKTKDGLINALRNKNQGAWNFMKTLSSEWGATSDLTYSGQGSQADYNTAKNNINTIKEKTNEKTGYYSDITTAAMDSDYINGNKTLAEILGAEKTSAIVASGLYSKEYLDSNEITANSVIKQWDQAIKDYNSAVTAFKTNGYNAAYDSNGKFLEELNGTSLTLQINKDSITEESNIYEKFGAAVGMTGEQLRNYALELVNNKTMVEADAATMAEYASQYYRVQKGLQAVIDNLSTYRKNLKSASAETKSNATQSIRNLYKEMFTLGKASKYLGDEFIRDEENLKLLEQAAKGNADAYDELQKKTSKEIWKQSKASVDIDNGAAFKTMDEFLEYVSNVKLNDITIGATVDDADFLNQLSNMQFESEEFAKVAQEILALNGINTNINEVTLPGNSSETTTTGSVTVQSSPLEEPTEMSYSDTSTETTSGRKVYTLGNPTVNANYKPGGSDGRRGGGGGGGRRKDRPRYKKSELKKPSEEIERYHEVKKSLASVEHQLNLVAKAKDAAFGVDRIKALKQENALIQQQTKLNEQYYQEALAYQKSDAANLAKYGFTFDDYGNINNYDEIMNQKIDEYNEAYDKYFAVDTELVDRYNMKKSTKGIKKLTDDTYKELKDDADEGWGYVGDAWDEFTGDMEKYEDSIENLQAASEAWYDNIQSQLANKIEQLSYVVELKIEVSDETINLLKDLFADIGDNADRAADAIANLGKQTSQLVNKSATYQKSVSEVLKQGLQSLDLSETGKELFELANGYSFDEVTKDPTEFINAYLQGGATITSEMLEKMHLTSEQIETLKNYQSELYSINEELRNATNEAIETAANAFSEYNERIQDSIDKIEHLQKVTATYGEIVDIIGKKVLDPTGSLTKILANANFDMQRNNTAALKSQLTNAESDIEAWKKQIEAAKAEGISDNDLDTMNEKLREFEQERDSIYESWLDSWQAEMQAAADIYTASLDNIINTFEAAVAGLAGGLSALSEEYERQKTISDVYLDEYKQIYDLSKLTRDINNSIDDTTTIKSKQALKQIIEKINGLQEDGVKLSQYDLDVLQAEYELELAREKLEEAREAKTTVRMARDSEGNYGYVYTADDSAVKEAEQNYEDKLYAMQKLNSDYIDEMQSQIIQAEQDCSAALAELNVSDYATYEEYEAAALQIQKDYGELVKDYYQQLDNALENNSALYNGAWTTYSKATGYILGDEEEFLQEFEDTTLSQLTGLQTTQDGINTFTQATDSAVADASAAWDEWRKKTQIAMSDGGTTIQNYGSDATDVAKEVSQASKDMADSAADAADLYIKSFKSIVDELKKFQTEYDALIISFTKQAQTLGEALTNVLNLSSQLTEDEYFNGGDVSLPQGGSSNVSSSTEEFQTTLLKRAGDIYDEVRDLAEIAKKKYGGSISLFDTGGYTGNWGSSEGRLAVLHQKELVLKENDTANFLEALDTVKTISSMIDLNAAAASSGLAGLLSVGGTIQPSDSALQQNVSITAEFKDATSASEITAAFESLINRASQYANRK